MRTHIIIDGVVKDTIIATLDEAQALKQGATCIDGAVGGIGWSWDGEKLSPPVQSPVHQQVPESITQRQGRILLLRMGLLAAVDAYFASVGGEGAIEWEYATEWRRDWPLLIDAAHAVGLSDDQKDQMLIDASLI